MIPPPQWMELMKLPWQKQDLKVVAYTRVLVIYTPPSPRGGGGGVRMRHLLSLEAHNDVLLDRPRDMKFQEAKRSATSKFAIRRLLNKSIMFLKATNSR